MRVQSLNEIMEMDHVIYVDENGVVSESVSGVYAPEIHLEAFWDSYEDAHVYPEHERDMVAHVEQQGWTVFNRRVSHGVHLGPIIDSCYFIGGELEEIIRGETGYWVACPVEIEHPDDEDGSTGQGAGWVLAHRVAD